MNKILDEWKSQRQALQSVPCDPQFGLKIAIFAVTLPKLWRKLK